ncbi:hypothetical protein TRIUR3_19266 [Triticum urartu]|uniref:Uncharacterized protein n=1 Tax=Triticum urartu TaxID=4572 RepID=M7ZTN5_TRIUA|nr:hypothetical protein TRIUR3_19266 [Triticum urartu]
MTRQAGDGPWQEKEPYYFLCLEIDYHSGSGSSGPPLAGATDIVAPVLRHLDADADEPPSTPILTRSPCIHNHRPQFRLCAGYEK